VVWETPLAIRVGDVDLALTLRDWVNSGLMTFFFFVVGLEVRREFDLGELRDRRRVALPVLAGPGGMIVPVAIFLALNVGFGLLLPRLARVRYGLLLLLARRGVGRATGLWDRTSRARSCSRAPHLRVRAPERRPERATDLFRLSASSPPRSSPSRRG
jgi:hypothetical protein